MEALLAENRARMESAMERAWVDVLGRPPGILNAPARGPRQAPASASACRKQDPT